MARNLAMQIIDDQIDDLGHLTNKNGRLNSVLGSVQFCGPCFHLPSVTCPNCDGFYRHQPAQVWPGSQNALEVFMTEDKGSKAIKIVKTLMDKGVIKPDVTVPQLIDILDTLVQTL